MAHGGDVTVTDARTALENRNVFKSERLSDLVDHSQRYDLYTFALAVALPMFYLTSDVASSTLLFDAPLTGCELESFRFPSSDAGSLAKAIYLATAAAGGASGVDSQGLIDAWLAARPETQAGSGPGSRPGPGSGAGLDDSAVAALQAQRFEGFTSCTAGASANGTGDSFVCSAHSLPVYCCIACKDDDEPLLSIEPTSGYFVALAFMLVVLIAATTCLICRQDLKMRRATKVLPYAVLVEAGTPFQPRFLAELSLFMGLVLLFKFTQLAVLAAFDTTLRSCEASDAAKIEMCGVMPQATNVDFKMLWAGNDPDDQDLVSFWVEIWSFFALFLGVVVYLFASRANLYSGVTLKEILQIKVEAPEYCGSGGEDCAKHCKETYCDVQERGKHEPGYDATYAAALCDQYWHNVTDSNLNEACEHFHDKAYGVDKAACNGCWVRFTTDANSDVAEVMKQYRLIWLAKPFWLKVAGPIGTWIYRSFWILWVEELLERLKKEQRRGESNFAVEALRKMEHTACCHSSDEPGDLRHKLLYEVVREAIRLQAESNPIDWDERDDKQQPPDHSGGGGDCKVPQSTHEQPTEYREKDFVKLFYLMLTANPNKNWGRTGKPPTFKMLQLTHTLLQEDVEYVFKKPHPKAPTGKGDADATTLVELLRRALDGSLLLEWNLALDKKKRRASRSFVKNMKQWAGGEDFQYLDLNASIFMKNCDVSGDKSVSLEEFLSAVVPLKFAGLSRENSRKKRMVTQKKLLERQSMNVGELFDILDQGGKGVGGKGGKRPDRRVTRKEIKSLQKKHVVLPEFDSGDFDEIAGPGQDYFTRDQLSEWIQRGGSVAKLIAPSREDSRIVFEQLDANNDGELEWGEVKHLKNKQGQSLTEQQFKAIAGLHSMAGSPGAENDNEMTISRAEFMEWHHGPRHRNKGANNAHDGESAPRIRIADFLDESAV